ncbi:MAG: hypothetical protein AAFQ79_17805 [Pseudomonadota bacterium]
MFSGLLDGKFQAALFSLISVVTGAGIYLNRPWEQVTSLNPLTWPLWLQGAAGLVLAGIVLPKIGGQVIRSVPRWGLLLIEARIFWVIFVLSAMVTVGLFATELLATGDDDPADRTAALGAVEKALTAVITAFAVALVGENTASSMAKTSRKFFGEAFKGYGKDVTDPGEKVFARMIGQAVFSEEFTPEAEKNRDGSKPEGASGWGWDARWSRAKTIAANLR